MKYKALVVLVLALVCTVLLWGRVIDGTVTVTTAGNRVQLSATATECWWVLVQAKEANTGNIFVGGGTVADGRGAELDALDSHFFPILPKGRVYVLTQLYVDAETNGEGATYTCMAKGQ